jgi:hypothetical protein
MIKGGSLRSPPAPAAGGRRRASSPARRSTLHTPRGKSQVLATTSASALLAVDAWPAGLTPAPDASCAPSASERHCANTPGSRLSRPSVRPTGRRHPCFSEWRASPSPPRRGGAAPLECAASHATFLACPTCPWVPQPSGRSFPSRLHRPYARQRTAATGVEAWLREEPIPLCEVQRAAAFACNRRSVCRRHELRFARSAAEIGASHAEPRYRIEAQRVVALDNHCGLCLQEAARAEVPRAATLTLHAHRTAVAMHSVDR